MDDDYPDFEADLADAYDYYDNELRIDDGDEDEEMAGASVVTTRAPPKPVAIPAMPPVASNSTAMPSNSNSDSIASKKRPREDDEQLAAASVAAAAVTTEAQPAPAKRRRTAAVRPSSGASAPISIDLEDNTRATSQTRDDWSGVVNSLPAIGTSYIPVTSSDGDRVYVLVDESKVSNDVDFQASGKLINTDIRYLSGQTKSVLSSGKTIQELMDLVDRNRMRALLREKQTQQNTGAQQESQVSQVSSREATSKNVEHSLFVDKYAPANFTDLLTDEKINRDVLKWVKEWDPFVFKKKQQSNDTKPGMEPRLPEQRILLLAGPPGVGKTTLAHVIARQAGYEPTEINASDDRSPDKILEFLEAAGTRSIRNMNRPKLLIFDEIDGVLAAGSSEGKSSIDVLLKVCYPPVSKAKKQLQKTGKAAQASASAKQQPGKKTKAQKPSTAENGKSSGKSKLPRQHGPIICICNDVYAPVLRDLRAKSKLFVFKKQQVQTDRIVERLQQICRKEQLDIPQRVLSELVSRSDGDVRSCLNNLQFLKKSLVQHQQLAGSAKLQPMSIPTLSAMVADKDIKRDYFDIFSQIFSAQSKLSANQMSSPPMTLAKEKTQMSSTQNLYSLLASELGNERFLIGCFETFPHVKFVDVTGKKMVSALDWTCLADHVLRLVGQTQQYQLLSYFTLAIVNYHTQCASNYRPQIQFPKVEYEQKVKLENNCNILRSFVQGIETKLHLTLPSIKDVSVDLVPSLVRILAPKIRATNTSLLSNEEREIMRYLVNIHVSYGLRYTHIFADGQPMLKLDPDLFSLNNFGSQHAIKELPYAIKKLVSHDAEQERFKRTSIPEDKSKQHEYKAFRKQTTQSRKSAISPQSHGKQQPLTVYFKYHEGTNNSIRRPAKIQEFL